MKTFEFVRSVTVEGKAFQAGDQIGETDIPADGLASCLRVGYVVEVPAAPTAPAASAPEPTSKPEKGKK